MSRVGKVPVKILQGIKVEFKDRLLKVEGPKGKLQQQVPEGIEIKVEKEEVFVTPVKGNKKSPALQGCYRSIIANMIKGCHTGFVKELDINGVGYRAAVKGSTLALTLGFSHPVDHLLPAGISAKVDKNTHIVLSGIDKVLLGEVAAKIRSYRPPEPYRGKGVKYTDERILRKQGKAAGAK